MEEDFNEALQLLDSAFFSIDQCLQSFTNTSLWEKAKELCEKTIAGIHSHIRSAMNPIEEALWMLNSACATQLKHEDFLIKELEKIKLRLEMEPTGTKLAWYNSHSQSSRPTWPTRKKRAVGIITMAILAVAAGFAAAVPITLAVENTAQQRQIDSLHTSMNLHQEALEFIEDSIEPIDFINAASTNGEFPIEVPMEFY